MIMNSYYQENSMQQKISYSDFTFLNKQEKKELKKSQNKAKTISKKNSSYILQLLFPNVRLNPEQIQSFCEYVNESLKNIHCCVCYKYSKRFVEFCSRVGFSLNDLELREVVIQKDTSILFTEKYLSPLKSPFKL